MAINRFPVVRNGGNTVAWNMHRVNMDRLPLLDISQTEQLDWLNPAVSGMFSESDRTAREGRVERDLVLGDLYDMKDSLHVIFVRTAGIQSAPSTVFALNCQGRSDTLLFITGLRLDLPAHTVVADTFVLPMQQSLVGNLRQALGRLKGVVQVRITHDELILWKRVLPAMVERCRTWEHKDDCLYRQSQRIPISVQYSQIPICECGRGLDTNTFKTRIEWRAFAPYVTRIAICPLFPVSYVESVGGAVAELAQKFMEMKGEPPLNQCSKCGVYAGRNVKLLVCSKCKTSAYCSKACQAAHCTKAVASPSLLSLKYSSVCSILFKSSV